MKATGNMYIFFFLLKYIRIARRFHMPGLCYKKVLMNRTSLLVPRLLTHDHSDKNVLKTKTSLV